MTSTEQLPSTPSPETEEVDRNPSGKTFFGHPRMLAHLFSVEMWERFSFYGMQGILAIYMYFTVAEGGLGIDKSVSLGIVGAYGGSVFLFSILGAWIADRLLGPERAMFYSAILIMLGHASLALLPGVGGLIVGLAFIAIGSGVLKANSATLVGSLYDLHDPRRDAGFSIFYMGVNLGGFIGPILTGLAQKEIGFHLGFGLAAIGMAIGLVQYGLARRDLPAHVSKVPDPITRSQLGRPITVLVLILVALGVLLGTGVLNAANLANAVALISALAAIVIFVVLLSSPKVDGTERGRVVSFIPMFIGSTAFFALFQQQFTVLTTYADTRVNRDILGWTMPISWPASFNPFFIIVLSPVFAWLWTKLGHRQPSTPVKFSFGLFFIGACFLLFVPMAHVEGVPVLWVALAMLVATLGELMLSPVGLSLASKLAPKAFPVMMMALFYLSSAVGTALSGSLAAFYSRENETVYFSVLGAVTVALGLIMLAIARPVHSAMRGVD